MQRKIAIIGTGYVGLTVGLCLARLGHQVTCMDKDEGKIGKLRQKKIPIFEPGLKEILENNQDRISFSPDLGGTVNENQVIFICVGTPPDEKGEVDLTQFEGAVEEIAQEIDEYKVIVDKSTVPVGTGEWVGKEVKSHYQGTFDVVSNPEFLREGSAVQDFLNPDRVVIGVGSEKAEEIMLDIYSSIDAPKVTTDIESAELIKYAANAFLGTKISFINEIANICERAGGDVEEVAKGIGLDDRIGPKFLNAGIGYGGNCFPKDIEALKNFSQNAEYNFKLLEAVMAVNKQQKLQFTQRIKNILEKNEGEKVGIWGLAFKPNTDDVRKAPSLEIIEDLQQNGYEIKAYDPQAMENAKKELASEKVEYCKTPVEAAKDVSILVLITEWPEFSEVDMKDIKRTMKHPYLLDGRNFLDGERIEELGFVYEGVGKGN